MAKLCPLNVNCDHITAIIGVLSASISNLIDADVPNRLFELIQYTTRRIELFYRQLSIRKDPYVAL